MFYPVEALKRGGRFYLCWIADSWPTRFATVKYRQLRAQDIGKICDDLLEVMKNESGRAMNRFSLRLSSQLLRGLVRLYQKKVDLFMCDVCMINAYVMKRSHKKLFQTDGRTVIEMRPSLGDLPRLVIEELDDERLEEQNKNTDNLVARVQDITLQEPSMPENRLLIDDGFGELPYDQSLHMMLGDRSVETMMVQDNSAAQHSALDLPLDFSVDRSHDRSRLAPHDAAQMERISEHDISVFRKSGEAPTLVDFEKEMLPEISELPPPDLPAPQPQNQVDALAQAQVEEPTTEQSAPEKRINDSLVLEELESEPRPKRQKRNKLIRDKKIKLSSDYFRTRIGNNNLELRCENRKEEKVINIFVPARVLLHRPTHCGSACISRLGSTLKAMYTQKLAAANTVPTARTDTDVEQAMPQRTTRVSAALAITARVDTTVQNVQEVEAPTVVPHERDAIEMIDLPTQVLLTTSQAEERAGIQEQMPRKRRWDYVFRQRQSVLDICAEDSNKENVPSAANVLNMATPQDVVQRRSHADRLTQLLQQAGLADVQDRAPDIEPATVAAGQSRRHNSEDTETPLGSLDRTKVSLGDSDKTTDSKRFIRDQWGTQGTMFKIFRYDRMGVSPITVESLVTRGPVIAGHRRIIAARCFHSILKLKQHRFINVVKDHNTNEIRDIMLGERVTKHS